MKKRNALVACALVLVLSLLAFASRGLMKIRNSPPVPEVVTTVDGVALMTAADIREGRAIWRSIGGQEIGSIWGEGAALAPDLSADWLHRESVLFLDHASFEIFGNSFSSLTPEQQLKIRGLAVSELRQNTYDPETRRLTLSPLRAELLSQISRHYASVFMDDTSADRERRGGTIPRNAVRDPKRMAAMNAFFFWSAWACGTNRPGSDVSYTNNWPTEPIIGNLPVTPVSRALIFATLLAGAVGFFAFFIVARRDPRVDAGAQFRLGDRTPSMHEAENYFWTAGVLFLAQTLIGGLIAEPAWSTGLSASMLRTCSSLLGVMWASTALLGVGLYVAPALSGFEPRAQARWVRVLLLSFLAGCVGLLASHIVAIWHGSGFASFDPLHAWQFFISLAVLAGVALMTLALRPLFDRSRDALLIWCGLIGFCLVALFVSVVVIDGGQAVWAARWAEALLRFGLTVAASICCVSLGLVSLRLARGLVAAAALLLVVASIVGTGSAWTPAVDALARVPLALLGVETLLNMRWMREPLRWPTMFFIAAALWNMVGVQVTWLGAGGFLGIGLMLLVFGRPRNEARLNLAFWTLNAGLSLHVFLSAWPIGLLQLMARIEQGDWFAHSAEFLQRPLMSYFRSMRAVGDTLFLIGCAVVLALIWFERVHGAGRKKSSLSGDWR